MHYLYVISDASDRAALCRLTSMRNSLTPIKRWRLHGNLEVKRLVSDTMTLGQSLLLSQHIGRAILPELSLFVAVKIPLAASPGTRLSPPHPSLTQRPLSVMPTLVSQSRWAGGGLGSAVSYWFMNSALWRQCNNGDLNVR